MISPRSIGRVLARTAGLALPFLFLLPAFAGCSSSSGDDQGCTLLGCTSSATFVGYATLAHDDMAKATITACRRGGCSAGKPTSLPSLAGDKVQVPLAGQASAQANVYAPDGKGYKIEVTFSIDDQTSENGDPYELKITKADGSVANDYQANATYQEVAPNGPGCPPVCKTTTIDKSGS